MPRKLLDQVRDIIPVKHYSYRTEKSYGDCCYPADVWGVWGVWGVSACGEAAVWEWSGSV